MLGPTPGPGVNIRNIDPLTPAPAKEPVRTVFWTRVYAGSSCIGQWLSVGHPHNAGPNTFQLVDMRSDKSVTACGEAIIIMEIDEASAARLKTNSPW